MLQSQTTNKLGTWYLDWGLERGDLAIDKRYVPHLCYKNGLLRHCGSKNDKVRLTGGDE